MSRRIGKNEIFEIKKSQNLKKEDKAKQKTEKGRRFRDAERYII
jgi:hypothetical protein